MRRITTSLTVLLATFGLVVGVDYVSFAATGSHLILGKTNSAGAVTTIKRTTAGPPLRITSTSSSAPPLVVNGKGKVGNLNADKVDGLDSSAFRLKSVPVDATTLNGQHADALRTSTRTFHLAISSKITQFEVTVPLAPGTWILGYSATLPGAGVDGGKASCLFHHVVGVDDFGVAQTSQLTKASYIPSLSGTAVVTLGTSSQLSFMCFADGAFITQNPEQPIKVYATRTTLLDDSDLTP